MKLFFDFLPVLLFFAVYQFYGSLPPELIGMANAVLPTTLAPGEPQDAIFLATAVAMASAIALVAGTWLVKRHVPANQWIALAVIVIFGGATLVLHDPLFIKWKPSILNWLFAGAFLASHWIGERTLAERLMGRSISVPGEIWGRVNLAWTGFFLFSGLANIAVAYGFSEAVWVKFKLFGLFGLTIAFVIGQAIYLARHMEEPEEEPIREEI